MNYFKDTRFKSNLLLAACIIFLAYIFLNLNTVGNFISAIITMIKPFIIGICIAFVLNLPMCLLEEKVIGKLFNKVKNERIKGITRPVTLILTLIIIVGVIIGLILFVIPQLVESGSLLVKNIPHYIESFEAIMNNHISSQATLGEISDKLSSMGSDLLNILGGITESIISELLNITMGVTTTIINFILGVVIAIYILLGKEKLSLQTKKILYAFLGEKKADYIGKIADISNNKFSKFVIGQCLEAVILGAMCFLGMCIFKLPYALLISTIIGITALIPIFGAFIGIVPGVFIIFMISPVKALWFIVLIIAIQQIEGHLIYPMVVGNSIGLSAIWVLFAITVGGSIAGVVGILIGVPLFGVIYSVLGAITNERLKKKNIDIT